MVQVPQLVLIVWGLASLTLIFWVALATISWKRGVKRADHYYRETCRLEKHLLTRDPLRKFLLEFARIGTFDKAWIRPMEAMLRMLDQDFIAACQEVQEKAEKELEVKLLTNKGQQDTREILDLRAEVASIRHVIDTACRRRTAA